jgi:hypothetical protein
MISSLFRSFPVSYVGARRQYSLGIAQKEQLQRMRMRMRMRPYCAVHNIDGDQIYVAKSKPNARRTLLLATANLTEPRIFSNICLQRKLSHSIHLRRGTFSIALLNTCAVISFILATADIVLHKCYSSIISLVDLRNARLPHTSIIHYPRSPPWASLIFHRKYST